MTPHAFDLAILVIILLSTVTSYFRGIIREFFIFAGFLLAVFVSAKGGHILVPGLDKWLGATGGHEKASILGLLKPSMAGDIASYGGVFLLIFGLMIVIRILVTRVIQDAGLTVVDRILGAVFGFLRGFLLIFVVYAACFYLITPSAFPDWATKSYSVPILNKTLTWTNKNIFNLNSIIEDRGGSIAVKLNKVDLSKAGSHGSSIIDKMKSALTPAVQKIEQTPPPVTPQSAPLTAPQTAPVMAPQTAPQVAPQTAPETAPPSMPQSAPPSTQQSAPPSMPPTPPVTQAPPPPPQPSNGAPDNGSMP